MSKTKMYLISIFLGIVLLFYSILEIKPVVVSGNDFLGLISHLTLAYWVGYILLIICSVKLYMDNEVRRDSVYLICLIVIGLFLFGLPVFTEENARFAWSYYPAGEIKSILDTSRIDKMSESELGSYHSWPGSHFISASLIYLANIKIDDIIKYMPIFWVFSVLFGTYGVGKLLKLPGNQCFLISLLVISSFWTMNYYYGPQSLAYILYILFFASILFIYMRNNAKDIILMRLIFVATVVTHMLTSIALILSFLFSSKYIKSLSENRMKLAIFFIIVFAAWNLFAAPLIFEYGISDLKKQVTSGELFDVFSSEKYNTGNTLIRQTIHYSRMSFLGIYAIAIMAAAILYVKGKIIKENRELVKICFFWLAGILVLLMFRYGAEIDDRVYILSLLPMALILTMSLEKKVISTMVILLMILHLPAHYGTESFDMTYTTDIQGSKFIASKIDQDDSINYYYAPFVRYYNREFSNSKGFDKGYYNPDNQSLISSTYVISSKQLDNYLLYVFGTNNVNNWVRSENGRYMLLYDNGYYGVYKNNWLT